MYGYIYIGGYTNIHHKIQSQSSPINYHQPIMAAAASSTSLSSWTHKKLVKTVINDEPTLIRWLQSKNLLASDMTCPKCGSQCRIVLVSSLSLSG